MLTSSQYRCGYPSDPTRPHSSLGPDPQTEGATRYCRLLSDTDQRIRTLQTALNALSERAGESAIYTGRPDNDMGSGPAPSTLAGLTAAQNYITPPTNPLELSAVNNFASTGTPDSVVVYLDEWIAMVNRATGVRNPEAPEPSPTPHVVVTVVDPAPAPDSPFTPATVVVTTPATTPTVMVPARVVTTGGGDTTPSGGDTPAEAGMGGGVIFLLLLLVVLVIAGWN